MIRRALRNRKFIDAAKNKPCKDCGRRFPPVAMDFDHVRGVKKIRVAGMLRYGLPMVRAEIAKCDVVCSNCHRIRTSKLPYFKRKARGS